MQKSSMGIDVRELDAISAKLRNLQQQQADADEKLFNDKMDRLEAEYNRKVQIQKDLTQMGLRDNIKQYNAKMKALEAEKKKALKDAKDSAHSPDELKAKEKQIEAEFKLREKQELKLMDKKTKWALKYAKAQEKQASYDRAHKDGGELLSSIFGKGVSLTDRVASLSKAFRNDDGSRNILKGVSTLMAGLSDLTRQMDKTIDEIASKKSSIDTRLQGSKNKTRGGSYWDQLSSDVLGIAGVSPLIRQENVVSKIQEYVGKGIAYNVEQRAFLATMSEKIANTFNAADGTLLRLVRIQQQDSTAGRLGMESMITAFLNNMYETTEYLNGIADSVRSSLDEVESLMGAADAVALEYQVQKWMGSLYSVGMSQNAVGSIAAAFGQMAAGDISGLTSGGMGNLMIMAANQAGLSIADILADGLDDSDTNRLMAAMVDYLQVIAAESSNSRVVQQQIAKVYGLTASDLRAAMNLKGSTSAISKSNLTYSSALNQLNSMASSMYARTSIGEMMTNAWDNFKYSMSAGIANNPALYAIYKIANLLSDTGSDYKFSIPTYMGTGMAAQTFSVADIMRVAALSGSLFEGLGKMITSGSAGGISGSGMLKALGLTGLTTVTRGNGQVGLTRGASVSESGTVVGNASSEDIKNKSMTETTDSTKQQVAEAKEDESNDLLNRDLNDSILKIYDLLQGVISGGAIRVKESFDSVWSH